MYFTFIMLGFGARKSCEYMFKSNLLQEFLKGSQAYDVAITEYFASDCALAVIIKIQMSDNKNSFSNNDALGIP